MSMKERKKCWELISLSSSVALTFSKVLTNLFTSQTSPLPPLSRDTNYPPIYYFHDQIF